MITVPLLVCLYSTTLAMDVYDLAMSGESMTAGDAEYLEKQLKKNPGDFVALLLQMLGLRRAIAMDFLHGPEDLGAGRGSWIMRRSSSR